jgi:hypothetical protein
MFAVISNFVENPAFITYALVAAITLLLAKIVWLEIKLRRLLVGKNSVSIEESLLSTKANLEKLNVFQKNAIEHLETVEKRLARSVQAVKTIRFNPFKGTGEGGSQSFATAFVSENGDGVVISSLYSRERVSVFSKPLQKFESSFELTDEEQGVVKDAKKNLS